MILKAFTKIFAMAGLRLGYCVCGDSSLCGKIAATLQPWAVSTPASKAGTAALQVAETGFVERTKAYVDENRQFLADGLKPWDTGSTTGRPTMSFSEATPT